MTNAPRPIIDLTATCACGAVTMSVSGPIVSMLQCSCLDCQRATGAGHADVAAMRADAIRVEGATKSFNRRSASGAIFTRHFCPECGTGIYGQSSRAPALRMFMVGFFAGQNDWFAPNQLIFARSHPHWDLIADHLPRHATYREAANEPGI